VAEHCNLYDRAKYYDIVFRRDVTGEVGFFKDLYRKHLGKDFERVIDVACGPGYHGRALALQGYKTYGLDLRAEMLRFAAEETAQETPLQSKGSGPEWIEADMRTFKLKQPVDMAFCVFDGLDCLLTNENLKLHFQAVAANLTPGGLYLIDLSHPSEIDWTHYKKFHYSGQRDGIKVDIHWATNDPTYDLATGIAKVEVKMLVDDHGQKIEVVDMAEERLMFPQEINLLAELSGALKVLAWYGDFDINRPLDSSPKSRRMIGVLQKIG
jgi:SAM-dependent methyltransferase